VCTRIRLSDGSTLQIKRFLRVGVILNGRVMTSMLVMLSMLKHIVCGIALRWERLCAVGMESHKQTGRYLPGVEPEQGAGLLMGGFVRSLPKSTYPNMEKLAKGVNCLAPA